MDEDALFQDLLAAVEQQLVAPRTRYVAMTFERLVSNGMSAGDARERIAASLGEETDAMYRRKSGFDEMSYRRRLDAIDPGERFEPEPEQGNQAQ